MFSNKKQVRGCLKTFQTTTAATQSTEQYQMHEIPGIKSGGTVKVTESELTFY